MAETSDKPAPGESPVPPNPPAVTGSSDLAHERATHATRLAEHAARGEMTLDEYARRAVAIEQASTHEQLRAASLEVPESAIEPPKHHRSWVVAVFGGSDQRGRWRLSRRLRVVSVFGGAHLDLSSAQPEAPECTIAILALFGGVEIVAPIGVPIALSGLSLLGGRSDQRPTDGPPLPGSPIVRVRALAILGGVKVREPHKTS